jgi:hypothetical protein
MQWRSSGGDRVSPLIHLPALPYVDAYDEHGLWYEQRGPYSEDDMFSYATKAVTFDRYRIAALIASVREHWVKVNGEDSISVSALDVIASVIADGSYVHDEHSNP